MESEAARVARLKMLAYLERVQQGKPVTEPLRGMKNAKTGKIDRYI